MKLILLSLAFLTATPVAAQESCICLKCLLGQYSMVQPLSQSMAPAFEPGQCHYARYLNGEFERLQYGDVIYFEHPVIGGQYLDRVIAMGGDTVQMIEGVVWLNGKPLPQEKIEDYTVPYELSANGGALPMCQNRPEIGGVCSTERYLETLPNGVRYEVLNIGDRIMDNTEVFNVPDGFVFVLGDHRDNSIDSRFQQSGPYGGIGFVPLENIIGVIEDD